MALRAPLDGRDGFALVSQGGSEDRDYLRLSGEARLRDRVAEGSPPRPVRLVSPSSARS
jgi:hypothetical protein